MTAALIALAALISLGGFVLLVLFSNDPGPRE